MSLKLVDVAGLVLIKQIKRDVGSVKFGESVRELLAGERSRIALLRDMPQKEMLKAMRVRFPQQFGGILVGEVSCAAAYALLE